VRRDRIADAAAFAEKQESYPALLLVVQSGDLRRGPRRASLPGIAAAPRSPLVLNSMA
jgi:hypothetical protein